MQNKSRYLCYLQHSTESLQCHRSSLTQELEPGAHVSWLQVMNQWLGICYNGLHVKPCLERLHIILGVTKYLKYINPLQTKAMKRGFA